TKLVGTQPAPGNSSPDDFATAVAVDTVGNVYVGGYTLSLDFPVTSAAYQTTFGGGFADGFVTELNPQGALPPIYSTYFGGNSDDKIVGLGLDSTGNVLVGGFTTSSNLPLVSPIQAGENGGYDAFLAKLNLRLSGAAALLFSTYFGGAADEFTYGLTV